jgi:ABC-2 type transport system permease protein
MRKAIAIALNELRVQLRQPATLVSMVFLPAALIFVIGLANGQSLGGGGGVRTVPVEVRDLDQTPESAALLAAMRAAEPALVLCPMDDGQPFGEGTVDCGYAEGQTDLTDAQIADRLTNETVEAFLSIPAGFAAALSAGEQVDVTYRSADSTPTDSPVLRALNAAIQQAAGTAVARRTAASVSADVFEGDAEYVEAAAAQASALWATAPITVTTEWAPGDPQDTAPGFQQSVPGMGSMYVMSTVLAGAAILIAERKTMTLQRLATMPVTPAQIIGGKLLARLSLGMIQYGIAFGVGLGIGLATGISFGNNPLALIFVALAFTWCMSGLALFFATVVKSDEQAASLGTLLSLTLAPIGGAWWSLDLEFIPEFMKTLSYLSPFRYAMDGFTAVIRQGGGFAEVLPSSMVLIVAGAVLFGLAVRRFKVA